jgi:uncharacterized protein
MGMNWPYKSISDLPLEIPVFPLTGCLLLPRCELPLNVFEPRYIAMIDFALKTHRIVGMIQPSADQTLPSPQLYQVGCAGKLTRFAETGDGRYIISLEGVCRFEIERETTHATAFRTFSVGYDKYGGDLLAAGGEEGIDRDSVFRALRAYSQKNSLAIDWDSVLKAPSETLVNALSMMSPFGAVEKQALLEACDLKARAEVLVAMTEMHLAGDSSDRAPLH